MVWITTVTQCYFVPLCMHFNTTSRYLCEVWYLAKLWKRYAAATEPWFITTQLFLKLQGWMVGWEGTPLQYETCLVCNWPILCHFWLKIGPSFLFVPPSLPWSLLRGDRGKGLHLGNATPPSFLLLVWVFVLVSSTYQIWYVYPTYMVWITTVTQCYFVPLCMHFNTTSRYLCEVWYLAKLWKRYAAATEPWFITTQLFLV